MHATVHEWILDADDRAIGSLCTSPDLSLIACTDDKGRVLMIDTATNCIVRIWKGRRDAQLGWLVARTGRVQKTRHRSANVSSSYNLEEAVCQRYAVHRHRCRFGPLSLLSHSIYSLLVFHRDSGHASDGRIPSTMYLVMYATKQGMLEIWPPRVGKQIRSFRCGTTCRLVRVANLPGTREDRNRKHNMRQDVELNVETDCVLLDLSCGMMTRVSVCV